MKQITIFGLILSSLSAGAETNTELRGPMHGWIADAAVVKTASNEEEVTGEGRVRRLADIPADVKVFTDPDGGKAVLLRIANDGASGVRLHFENLRLRPGSRLFVYGVDEANQVTASHGPYVAAGPTDSGEFWTRSMPGVAAIVELQFSGDLASLPFDLEEMVLADEAEWSTIPTAAAAQGEKRLSMFRGMAVDHVVVDGMAIWEGDIVLGRAEEMEPVAEGRKHDDRSAGSLTGTTYKWTGGVMPYVIDSTLPNQGRITAAINHWNTKLNGYVKLVARTNESYYVKFVPAGDDTCSSSLGMTRRAAQAINIGQFCSTGSVIHEIGHAFGLYHEQSRSDRDNYVRILTANIEPPTLNNFTKANSSNWTSYDYASIMHYGAFAFSQNGQPTIETIPAGISIGQRTSLSTGDINGIREMYPTTAPPSDNVNVSFSTNPSGRLLTVDGSTGAAPRSVQWTAGSTHSVSAPNQTSGTARYMFKQWSDGGAQAHNVTAPTSATTFTATYNLLYKVNISASEGGTVSVNPRVADGFYAANSVVNLTATAAANYCLTSWSGVLPVSSYAIAVTITRAADIQANFQVGAVTVPAAASAAHGGGLGTVNIGATSGCLWRAVSQADWITIEGSSTGSASAPLRLRVAPNTGARRTGTVLVNSRRITVTQQ